MMRLKMYIILSINLFFIDSYVNIHSVSNKSTEIEEPVTSGVILRFIEGPKKNVVHPPVWNYLFIDDDMVVNFNHEKISEDSYLNHMVKNGAFILGLFRYYKDVASCCGDGNLPLDSSKTTYIDISNKYRLKYFDEQFDLFGTSWSYSNCKKKYRVEIIRVRMVSCKCPLVINERPNYFVDSNCVTLIYPIDISEVLGVTENDVNLIESVRPR